MPGRTTGDNKFGPSPFVVGPVLGDGCNYLTIQEAINDAATAGGGQVFIRGGTYTEDLVLGTNVNLIGVDVSGVESDVIIIGNHTYTGNSAISFEAINFQCGAGTDIFNVTSTAPFLGLQFSNCDIDASLVSNGNGIVVNGSAFICAIVVNSTRVRADLHCFSLGGVTQMVFRGTCTSTNGNVILATSGFQIRYEDSFAASNVIGNFDLQGIGSFFCNHCRLQSQQETFTIGVGVEVQATNNFIGCDAGSGFFATGTGTLRYSDLSNGGSAIVIDPALISGTYDWKPYATTQPVATASGDRGTAQFYDGNFSATDGFVSLSLPAFMAFLSVDAVDQTGDGTLASLIADVVSVNIGGGYDGTTGVFTAPFTGTYLLGGGIRIKDISAGHDSAYLQLRINGGAITPLLADGNPFVTQAVSAASQMYSGSIIQGLTAGDTVQITMDVLGGTKTIDFEGDPGTAFSYFWGHLIE